MCCVLCAVSECVVLVSVQSRSATHQHGHRAVVHDVVAHAAHDGASEGENDGE